MKEYGTFFYTILKYYLLEKSFLFYRESFGNIIILLTKIHDERRSEKLENVFLKAQLAGEHRTRLILVYMKG